jgi:zinc transport system ATP-binding protein
MQYLKSHYDLAIILISHDLDYVKQYADHVVLLDQTVLKQGTVKEVFSSEEYARVFAQEPQENWLKGGKNND